MREPEAQPDIEELRQVTRAVARRILSVSESTWTRWERLGIAPKPVTLPFGTRRYRLAELRDFIAQHAEPGSGTGNATPAE